MISIFAALAVPAIMICKSNSFAAIPHCLRGLMPVSRTSARGFLNELDFQRLQLAKVLGLCDH
jgi:hypothetical protein